MNERTRHTFSKLARPLNLVRMIRLSGQTTVFPFYHTVSPESLPHIHSIYRVPGPEEFEKDLDLLLKWFEPLSLVDYLKGGQGKKGNRSMVLTFDDGLKGCHQFIAPLLREKGIPATFFLNNGFVDNRDLFYRYRAGLLIDRIQKEKPVREQVARFMKTGKEEVERSIRSIGWDRRELLESLCREAGVNVSEYLRDRPVYLNSEEIGDLLKWGFELGAHSMDHADFSFLTEEEIIGQVRSSIGELQTRFGVRTAYFSFPFTSDGVPGRVIDLLLDEGIASALLGTAGLKRTGRSAFIQRIPMEAYRTHAIDALKAEYLYYLLKMPMGKNRLRT